MRVKYVKGKRIKRFAWSDDSARPILIFSAMIIIIFVLVLPYFGILDWRKLLFSDEICKKWDNILTITYIMLCIPLGFIYLFLPDKFYGFFQPTNAYTSRSYQYTTRGRTTTTTINKFGLWRLDKKAVLKELERIKRKKDKEALENLINYLEELSKGFQSAQNFDAIFETYDMIVYLSEQRKYLY
jgi:hypothetical protein